MYFGQPVQDAVVRYNASSNPVVRNRIYREHIAKAFDKLAENIIHTFKFYYFDVPSEQVKHEVVSFLVMNMHKFIAGKGKAFSYFSIVAKNYLILHNNKNYKNYETFISKYNLKATIDEKNIENFSLFSKKLIVFDLSPPQTNLKID